MRRIAITHLVLLSLLLLANSPQAQTRPSAKPAQYFLVLLNRPPNAPQLSKDADEQLQAEHLANIRRMAAEHKLVLAGPFMEDTTLRGIFVFQGDSAAQVQDWANSDPSVKAGRLAPEVHGPWLIDPSAVHQPPANSEGMEQYTLVLMKRGDKWNPDAPDFMDVLKQHRAFVEQMTSKGSVAVAGLFPLDVPGELRAVAIFRVAIDRTTALLKEDPATKAGLLKPEIHPWVTGKGVLAPGRPVK
jgi:uncharacterized protein YciI